MRFERKYPISGTTPSSLNSHVRMHPFGFSELFPDRVVNSLYFDTPSLQFMQENLAGDAERMKVRIRWYGDFFSIRKPVLEVKIRRFELGDKLLFPLPDQNYNHQVLAEEGPALIRQLCPGDLDLQPAVYVSYERSYFGSADGKFRLTVDSDLRFRPGDFHLFHQRETCLNQELIAELKYDSEADELLSRFADYFPYRSNKNSKYLKGMMMTLGS